MQTLVITPLYIYFYLGGGIDTWLGHRLFVEPYTGEQMSTRLDSSDPLPSPLHASLRCPDPFSPDNLQGYHLNSLSFLDYISQVSDRLSISPHLTISF